MAAEGAGARARALDAGIAAAAAAADKARAAPGERQARGAQAALVCHALLLLGGWQTGVLPARPVQLV